MYYINLTFRLIFSLDMKDTEVLPVSTPTKSSVVSLKKCTGSAASAAGCSSIAFGRGRYKFWALGAILLLAFWSFLTGTVTLRLSAANFNNLLIDDSMDLSLPEDLDALEMDERMKFVKQMWDVYTSDNKGIRLSKFWQQAFEAAYERMSNDGVDDPEAAKAQEAAISEIARMSVISRIPFDAQPANSLSAQKLIRIQPAEAR